MNPSISIFMLTKSIKLKKFSKKKRKSIVSMMIRKIQYAPMKPGRQPCTMVRKYFYVSHSWSDLRHQRDC